MGERESERKTKTEDEGIYTADMCVDTYRERERERERESEQADGERQRWR